MAESDLELSVAEDDLELTWRRAVMHKRRRVVGVREAGGTSVLEERRVARSPASLRAVVVVPATQLVRTERLAAALAPHDVTVR